MTRALVSLLFPTRRCRRRQKGGSGGSGWLRLIPQAQASSSRFFIILCRFDSCEIGRRCLVTQLSATTPDYCCSIGNCKGAQVAVSQS